MPKPIARPVSIGPAWLRIIAIPHDVSSAQTKNCTNSAAPGDMLRIGHAHHAEPGLREEEREPQAAEDEDHDGGHQHGEIVDRHATLR